MPTLEHVARAITVADGVDPDHPCVGLGNLIPCGETWPAWKVRRRHAKAVADLLGIELED